MILFTFYYLYFWGWKREGWRGREKEDDIASSDEEGRLSFWFRRFEGNGLAMNSRLLRLRPEDEEGLLLLGGL